MGLDAVKNSASMDMSGGNPFDLFSNIFTDLNQRQGNLICINTYPAKLINYCC